tara:strand:+ start:767 stop:1663 length:897 start_codon:yes stop_codon:yes gene_type:complete
MKNNKLLILSLFFVCFTSCKTSITEEEISKYAATENYPTDPYLEKIESKKAMVIIAHDDDMCCMTGTLSLLNKKGWDIRVLSFPQTEDRNTAHIRACSNILDTVTFFNLKHTEFRNDIDSTEKLYRAVPIILFEKIFNYEIVERELLKEVNSFNPSVIFTLDNKIGGYGHPEHVFISQLVLDLSKTGKISPKYIYQSVYTDHMEQTIMQRLSNQMKEWGFKEDGWEHAKRTYEVNGTPAPDVQIIIESESENKMNYLKSYNDRERKVLGFYIPYFEDFKAEDYFKIFNREFYNVIKIN